jgi:hypothetical protein
MDPESIQMLMQYLSSAKKGNKGVSSVAGNLDNPILLALAGVLDPYYGSGQTTSGAGNLYGSFASDETTPAAVKAVMDYVDQGMNSYQIEAQINALDSDVIQNSGYTDEQLISMGREMAKEGGKKGTDVFAKAGLRNPNDIYGLGDVPLDASQSADYEKYLTTARESKKGSEMADWRLAVARNNMSKYTEDGVEVPDWFPTGAKGNQLQPGGAKGEQLRPTGAKGDQLRPTGAKGEQLQPTGAKGPQLRPTGGYTAKKKESRRASQEERDALSRAQAGVADVETQVAADLMRAQAVREGSLMRARNQGRTPFTDQTSTLLKFIAGSK